MKWRDWFDNWGLESLKVKAGFMELEFAPTAQDRHAAWELYVELLTRVSTQYLEPESGDEKDALDSIHEIFALTRTIIRTHGVNCQKFAKIAIEVLNQIIRPFTSRWHKSSLAGELTQEAGKAQFRKELRVLQAQLRIYTEMLGELAGAAPDLAQLAKT